MQVIPQLPAYTIDPVYETFKQFMLNPLIIRYDINEKIVTRKLSDLFNKTTGNNISFNMVFPRLMTRFMNEYTQFNITKKARKEGATYIGVGLVADPILTERRTELIHRDHEEAFRKRNVDKRKEYKREILWQIKNEILQRTSWTEINYRELINMNFISMFPTSEGYDIDATIKIAESFIIRYVYNKISKLTSAGQTAEHIKKDFQKSTEQDAFQTTLQRFPIYTQRNIVAPTIQPAVKELNKRIKSYVNTVPNLPVINHIVYPNIQYFRDLIDWLNRNSLVKTVLKMKREQATMEYVLDGDIEETAAERVFDEDIEETEETEAQRLIHARTLVTKITSNV